MVPAMPSLLHEVLVELFRQRPGFAAELLAEQLGVKIPDFDNARLDSIEFNDIVPTEFRADAVVTLTVTRARTRVVFAIVVEAQLRGKPRKRRTWPVYATTLAARLDCPVALLVLCDDLATAEWCAQPYTIIEPDCVLRPLVIGPRSVPRVIDPEQAVRSPELAVLSTRAHGDGPGRSAIFDALLVALMSLEDDQRRIYYGLAAGGLQSTSQTELNDKWIVEDDMLTEEDLILGDKLRSLLETGVARGEAKSVLAVLAARNVAVPEDARVRIARCRNLATLDRWLAIAVTATAVEELFQD
jgi:hypothetical protein